MIRNKSEYLKARKDEAIAKQVLSADDYAFYESLFLFQEKQQGLFAFKNVPGYIDRHGFPAIRADELEIPAEHAPALLAALDELCGIITARHPGFNTGPYRAHAVGSEKSIESLAKTFLEGEIDAIASIAGDIRTGIDEFVFMTANWFSPYFSALRAAVFGGRDTSEWNGTVCPFCGQYPSMAKIIEAKENKRVLRCSFCDEEWVFQRIGCALCGNDDIKKLGYYEFESSPYRFDYCSACGGYIKTFRLARKTDEGTVDLAVENILTNFLDSSAIAMGYKAR